MISEYGADTVSGLHVSPSWMFSEDYQSELLIKHHRAFDQLRSQGWFIGEHIWNFADFMTAQGRFYIYIYTFIDILRGRVQLRRLSIIFFVYSYIIIVIHSTIYLWVSKCPNSQISYIYLPQVSNSGFILGRFVLSLKCNNFRSIVSNLDCITGTTRVIGNRKGVLTRQRQPKAAAKILRCRYYMLARINTTDDSFYCPVPSSYWSYHTTQ